MRFPFTSLLGLLCITTLLSVKLTAQVSFTNQNSLFANPSIRSGCSMTVVDWNNDGLDDIVRLSQGRTLIIEVQKTGNQFETINFGQMNNASAWAMCVADVDKNGYKDVIGGWNGVGKIMMMSADGLTGTQVTLPNDNFFFQNITAADFNNDGWIDLFCCDDNGENTIYMNDGTGNFTDSGTSVIDFDVTTTDDSGNYGSVWTDFDNDGDLDLYIAKCRQGVTSPTDGRRINVLFENNGDGTFTSNAAEYGINVGWQSWTSSFGDIDNDGDQDLLLTNHDFESQIFENDGTGHYTDITSTTGFDINDITPIQSIFADFDNDGFVDILVTGSDARFFLNNGDKTFTKVTGLFNNNNMESFAIGDANNDGYLDIYGGYANIYTTPTSIDDVLWMNSGGNNNFIGFHLKGTASNEDAIGAKVAIYGPWGVQVREVRSGESYGTVNTFKLHFGLGSNTSVDSVNVFWPSGASQTIYNLQANHYVMVIENDCVSPLVSITTNGPAIICPGQSVELTAPAGYTYLWSNGETSQSISVSNTGMYNVMVSEANSNCFEITQSVQVTSNPDQTPVISAVGETKFCEGNSVNITGPDGFSTYIWSNGATTQNITATESGSYILTIEGICQQYSSTPITVTVLNSETPVTNDVILPAPGSATLNATGDNVNWYDVPTGGTAIGSGNSFVTPIVNSTTLFYAENTTAYNGEQYTTGMVIPSGTSQYSGDNSTNATTTFDVSTTCVLKSVQVFTDLAGTRKLLLRNSNGDLLDSLVVNIEPDSMIIELNWNLEPGTGYTIGTDGATNQAISGWGNLSPRLKRNSSGVTYPYTVTDVLSVTGSSFGATYYYYFYDWKVELPSYSCVSERAPAMVSIATAIPSVENTVRIFPNPANDLLTLQAPTIQLASVQLIDALGRVQYQVMNTNLSQPLQINTTTLANGLYTIRVSNAADIINRQIIIQH